MMNVRVFGPTTIARQTVVANGRTYNAVAGGVLDVPNMDAAVLCANGWTYVCISGPSSARPSTNPNATPPNIAASGVEFFDTTLGYIICHDGVSWRNPATGSAV
jgi:hypothetical protein